MIHDELIYALRLGDGGFHPIYEGDCEYMRAMVANLFLDDLHVFYFPSYLSNDKALSDTGMNFIKHDIFQPPFKNCLYIIDECQFILAFHHDVEGFFYHGDIEAPVPCVDLLHINFIKLGIMDDGYKMPEYQLDVSKSIARMALQVDENNMFDVADLDLSGTPIKENNLLNFNNNLRNKYLSSTIALSSKFIRKKQKNIRPSINAKRLKKGKRQLMSYSIIDLGRPPHSNKSQGGSHKQKSPIPHWRKGHTRILSGGRKIPVMPCPVAWNGSDKIENIPYKVVT